ncbi:MAG TPA: LLM class flavin-dependent oxidoreductase [Acidimicrobiia bacterium]|jgi:alkanesulfonate monooxygenase SsuD/methylene tetrahydromethanopterin reductase-like flavin-dependent oxidoreductase (luciferase family)
MPMLVMRHDFRAPAFGPASTSEIYGAAMEQFRWADQQGWDFAVVSEHHGLDDGWIPAPLTIAGVIAGRTERIPLLISAVVVPLHDPVRLAEQLAVLDHATGGRIWTVAGAGYRPEEFEMAGADLRRRGKLLEEYVGVMLQAWTGEPFEWQGRTIQVTPKPFSQPHPTILVGGGVEAAARRAARLRLPMMPMNEDPRLAEWYADEAAKTGFEGGFVMAPSGPTFVHVSHDPERAWAEIAPYVLYEAQTYASFQTGGQHSTPMVDAETVEDLKASPQYLVGTPDQIVEAAAHVSPMGALTFNPLAGGLPPDMSWASLELFASEVMPRLRSPG